MWLGKYILFFVGLSLLLFAFGSNNNSLQGFSREEMGVIGCACWVAAILFSLFDGDNGDDMDSWRNSEGY